MISFIPLMVNITNIYLDIQGIFYSKIQFLNLKLYLSLITLRLELI